MNVCAIRPGCSRRPPPARADARHRRRVAAGDGDDVNRRLDRRRRPATKIATPSSRNAVLSAANGCASMSNTLPRCCSRPSVPSRAPSRRPAMRTPAGSALRSDSPAANSPLTIASRTRAGHARRPRSAPRPARTRLPSGNFASAIGATFVNRQSSCRVVGKPTPPAKRAATPALAALLRRPGRGAVHVPSLARSRRRRASRSPSLRAPAPARGRRSAPCGRRSARARSPARCS